MAKNKKKQQQSKAGNNANVNERKEKKDRQDKKDRNKAKEDKKIVVERPRVFQLDFKECFNVRLKSFEWN